MGQGLRADHVSRVNEHLLFTHSLTRTQTEALECMWELHCQQDRPALPL